MCAYSKGMKISQQIEIKVVPGVAAFAQIVMGTKRSGQKRYESLEAAVRASEEMVAQYGAQITWLPFNADIQTQVGTYEFEKK